MKIPTRAETSHAERSPRAPDGEYGLGRSFLGQPRLPKRNWQSASPAITSGRKWLDCCRQARAATPYVLAAGAAHRVREFVERASLKSASTSRLEGRPAIEERGFDTKSGRETSSRSTARYFRPTEVELAFTAIPGQGHSRSWAGSTRRRFRSSFRKWSRATWPSCKKRGRIEERLHGYIFRRSQGAANGRSGSPAIAEWLARRSCAASQRMTRNS